MAARHAKEQMNELICTSREDQKGEITMALNHEPLFASMSANYHYAMNNFNLKNSQRLER